MSTPLISGPYSNSPLSNITPFTYRDGETYLEQLKRLRRWISEVAIALQHNIDQVAADDAAALAALATQLNTVLTAFVTEWTQFFLDAAEQSPAMVWDPTAGTVETFQHALNNVYDNNRIYAYFADQLDSFEYTALQWDTIEYEARFFDLVFAYSPTSNNAIDVIPPTVEPIP